MSQRRTCHHFASLRSLPFHFASSVNAQEITESDIRSYEGKLNKIPASRVTVECPLTHPFSRRSKGTASLRDVTDGYCALRHKRFVCMRCGRRYVNGKDLKRHEKYECGKSPRFKCPYCSQRAKYRSIIYNHVRARHPRMYVTTMDLGSDVYPA